MTPWIDIRLPYSSTGVFPLEGLPDSPDLSEEEQAKFGTTRETLWDKHADHISEIQRMTDLVFYDKALDLDTPEEEMDSVLTGMLATWLDENPEYREAYEAQKIREKIRVWRRSHPKTAAYEVAYDAARQADQLKTFKGRGLAVPGVQIEMEDGSRHLIGDVNPLGGTCEDCSAFDSTAIVARYRVLVNLRECPDA